jgi:hypothetical protein
VRSKERAVKAEDLCPLDGSGRSRRPTVRVLWLLV